MIILLFGRPGTGKYTIGSLVAQATGFRLIHNHAVVDLVTALFSFGSAPFIELRERLWLMLVDAAIEAGEDVILTFAPEATVTDGFLPALASRGGLHLIELRCSRDALEQRITNDSRKKFGKLQSVELYRELDGAGVFDTPVMPEAELVIDTGQMSAEEAADIIAKRLSEISDRATSTKRRF